MLIAFDLHALPANVIQKRNRKKTRKALKVQRDYQSISVSSIINKPLAVGPNCEDKNQYVHSSCCVASNNQQSDPNI